MTQDRVERLQHLERENLERSSATTAGLQRLLSEVAAAASRPDLFTGLSRVGQEQAALAYQQLTEAGIRFISRAMYLALAHRDDYLLGLLGPERVPVSAPPPMPFPSSGYDPVRWVGWYQLLVAWLNEQQARWAMLYRTLADEAAAGRLAPGSIQSSAQAFLKARHEGYLVETAELYAELVSEILDVTNGCIDVLTAAIAAGPTASQVVLEVRGPAAATAMTGLLIENAHNQGASVTCLAAPVGEFGLTVSPITMRLEPGESRPLAVQVALPPVPSSGLTLAGGSLSAATVRWT